MQLKTTRPTKNNYLLPFLKEFQELPTSTIININGNYADNYNMLFFNTLRRLITFIF